MNQNLKTHEQISALMDGQLQGTELSQALDQASSSEGLATWHAYQLVGDVMRSPELAQTQTSSTEFWQRLQSQLANEKVGSMVELPVAVAAQEVQLPAHAMPEAANSAMFRWKMAAGFASLVAVVAIGWNSAYQLQQSSGGGQQLASNTIHAAPGLAQPVTSNMVVASNNPRVPVMIRDPRLDELLASHQQYHGASALQMPASFLRNATFEHPKP